MLRMRHIPVRPIIHYKRVILLKWSVPVGTVYEAPDCTIGGWRMDRVKVVILCGGLGMRLREETEFKPKPMLEIGPKPILWHIMKMYAHYGFQEFVLCLGYKGEKIKQYFWEYRINNGDWTIELGRQPNIVIHDEHRETGWKVTLAETGLESMTGSRIKQIEKYIDTDLFMLTYGDGVSDVNIPELLAFHREHGKIGTVTGVRPPSRFGELLVSGNRVREFSEKPQISDGYINGGFFIFDKRVFEYVSADKDCVFERSPLENLCADGQLMMYAHTSFWQCMDTVRDMNYLNELWHSGKRPWQIWEEQ